MSVPKFLRSREFHLSLLIVSTLALLGMNMVAFSFDEDFTKLLYGDGINFDAPEAQHARAEATIFAKEIEEQSIVLLKNDKNALPMSTNKLNVFGYGSGDRGFIHQGGGSGRTSEYARTSFYDSLTASGIELNPSLVSFYNSFNYNRYSDSTIASLQFRNYELDPTVYPQNFFKEAAKFSPYAAVVFSRPATEKLDIPSVSYDRYGAIDSSRTALALSNNEIYLLNSVVASFKNVIVLLNSGNAIEASFADDSEIQAVLNIGYPGNTGCKAVGDILLGNVNPSGRSVDTFVYDTMSNPASINCGEKGNHVLSNGASYVDYAESIYVGYRYYETWFEENERNEREYSRVVAYPFGSGLSYTEFSWDLLESKFIEPDDTTSQIPNGARIENDGKLSFSLWVENTGTKAGRDVVELYSRPPYTKGGIEKSAVNLVGYAKTSLLEPGKGELVNIEVPLKDLSSYDCYDRNLNGFIGYELEAGDYLLSFRKNAHVDHPLMGKATSSFAFSIGGDGLRYDKDEVTGTEIKNLFTTTSNETSGAHSEIHEDESPASLSIDGETDQNITYLTRSDIASTFPKEKATRSLSKGISDTYGIHSPTTQNVHPKEFGTREIKSITEAFGKDYDDEIYEKLVYSCNSGELINFVQHSGFGTPALSAIEKPRCLDLDGPCGINTTVLSSSPGNAASYPSASTIAQSWDKELCYQYGSSVANEALALGVNGWYAPGANIHRSPLSGRNFEHFSEDPLLAGTSAAYVVMGAKDGGLYAYVKHLAADENETGTNGQYHFLTEQALREIYARPFEIAVKKGRANALMLSKNRIGYTRAAGSSVLIQDLLRKEWGFQGAVITDYYVGGNVMDADEAIRAGVDLILEGEKFNFDDTDSDTFLYNIARAAKNAIYCYADTMATANQAQSLPFDHLTGAKNDIHPIWKPIFIGADVVLTPLLVLYAIYIFKHTKGSSPEE